MILTAGDSFTYGEELDNRLEEAWPYLLGQHLNSPVENLGQCGESNDTIVRLVLRALGQRRYDLVVVGWTHWARFEVWNEKNRQPVTVMPASQIDLPWIRDYWRYSYDDDYSIGRWAQQAVLLQGFLKSLGQPYLFINVSGLHHMPREYEYLYQQLDPGCFVGWPSRGMIEITRDTPRGPGGHPLALGHKRIADEIITYIRH
jgi:hypothetical protein